MKCSYIALDLETTGLSPKKDRIIEIGAWKIVEDEAVEKYSFLIQPGRPIPQPISSLTHITDACVKDAPQIAEVLPEFLQFSDGLPLLGHNILFDYSFLKRWAVNLKFPFERSGVDTLKLVRRLVPQMDKKNLKDACSYFGIDLNKAHRAEADAWAAHMLFQKLKAEYMEGHSDLFLPKPLQYKVKKESPATKTQKEHLISLAKYHRIVLSVKMDSLTRNEASRLTDQLISKYGRINKKR